MARMEFGITAAFCVLILTLGPVLFASSVSLVGGSPFVLSSSPLSLHTNQTQHGTRSASLWCGIGSSAPVRTGWEQQSLESYALSRQQVSSLPVTGASHSLVSGLGFAGGAVLKGSVTRISNPSPHFHTGSHTVLSAGMSWENWFRRGNTV